MIKSSIQHTIHAPIAQWSERQLSKLKVLSSILSGGYTRK